MFEAGGPGGLSDIIGRGIAQGIAPALGQPVVVENRVGSNGVLGTDACAKGAPDGHTNCVLSNSYLSMNPFQYAKLPYDPVRDFVPAINVGFVGGLIVAHPGLPANSVREVVDMVRSKPGLFNWATWGSGSFAHLTVALLESGTGIAFNQVPYKAPAAALAAVMSGESHLTQNNPRVMLPLIKAGKVRAIGVTGRQRVTNLPEVPTLDEQGLTGLNFTSWNALYAPAGTPQNIVQLLSKELQKILSNPETRRRIEATGCVTRPGTSDALIKLTWSEYETYKRMGAESGIQLD